MRRGQIRQPRRADLGKDVGFQAAQHVVRVPLMSVRSFQCVCQSRATTSNVFSDDSRSAPGSTPSARSCLAPLVSRACHSEGDVRIDAQRQRLLLAVEAIVVPPVATTVGCHEKMQAAAVRDLPGLVSASWRCESEHW